MVRPSARHLAAIALLFALPLGACDLLTRDCDDVVAQWQLEIEESGVLRGEIPEGSEDFPMGLLLNQDAVNAFFRNLSDQDLGELSESVSVIGQTVRASVRPSLPALSVGGNDRCPACFQADVPFDVGIFLNRNEGPRGTGLVRVQLPVGLIPRGDERSAFIAQFQSIEVLNLQIDGLQSLSPVVYNAVEPIVSRLITNYLRSRFQDVEIASFRSWQIGRGDVLLAGRGPLVDRSSRTVMIALQSNLPTGSEDRLGSGFSLPQGADVGLFFHPNLLSAMARRMSHEGEIETNFSTTGEREESGALRATIGNFAATDEDLLEANVSFFRTRNYCGTLDVAADLGLTVEPGNFAFSIRNVRQTGATGAGELFSRVDQYSGGLLESMLGILDLTVNWDGLLAGEAATRDLPMQTFRAAIDSRGVGLYFNLTGE